MTAAEHTAQLTGQAAAELQDQFTRGEVNTLSCSTTFELGVDVGELEAILLRNVPPETANYIQEEQDGPAVVPTRQRSLSPSASDAPTISPTSRSLNR